MGSVRKMTAALANDWGDAVLFLAGLLIGYVVGRIRATWP